jgi:hypothetical protein
MPYHRNHDVPRARTSSADVTRSRSVCEYLRRPWSVCEVLKGYWARDSGQAAEVPETSRFSTSHSHTDTVSSPLLTTLAASHTPSSPSFTSTFTSSPLPPYFDDSLILIFPGDLTSTRSYIQRTHPGIQNPAPQHFAGPPHQEVTVEDPYGWLQWGRQMQSREDVRAQVKAFVGRRVVGMGSRARVGRWL